MIRQYAPLAFCSIISEGEGLAVAAKNVMIELLGVVGRRSPENLCCPKLSSVVFSMLISRVSRLREHLQMAARENQRLKGPSMEHKNRSLGDNKLPGGHDAQVIPPTVL